MTEMEKADERGQDDSKKSQEEQMEERGWRRRKTDGDARTEDKITELETDERGQENHKTSRDKQKEELRRRRRKADREARTELWKRQTNMHRNISRKADKKISKSIETEEGGHGEG